MNTSWRQTGLKRSTPRWLLKFKRLKPCDAPALSDSPGCPHWSAASRASGNKDNSVVICIKHFLTKRTYFQKVKRQFETKKLQILLLFFFLMLISMFTLLSCSIFVHSKRIELKGFFHKFWRKKTTLFILNYIQKIGQLQK